MEVVLNLKWFRRLKRVPVHEVVMKTLRRFIDEEEDVDYEETADAAVDRRKFLLNRIFKPWYADTILFRPSCLNFKSD